MRPDQADHALTPLTPEPTTLLLRLVSALEALAARDERQTAALESLAESQRRIADAVAPDGTKLVDTRYVADKLGLKTTQAVRDQINSGRIPKSCVVKGSGAGQLWRFYREKIDQLIERR